MELRNEIKKRFVAIREKIACGLNGSPEVQTLQTEFVDFVLNNEQSLLQSGQEVNDWAHRQMEIVNDMVNRNVILPQARGDPYLPPRAVDETEYLLWVTPQSLDELKERLFPEDPTKRPDFIEWALTKPQLYVWLLAIEYNDVQRFFHYLIGYKKLNPWEPLDSPDNFIAALERIHRDLAENAAENPLRTRTAKRFREIFALETTQNSPHLNPQWMQWFTDEGWLELKDLLDRECLHSEPEYIGWAKWEYPFEFMIKAIRSQARDARQEFWKYLNVYERYFAFERADSPQHFLDVLDREYQDYIKREPDPFQPPLRNGRMRSTDWVTGFDFATEEPNSKILYELLIKDANQKFVDWLRVFHRRAVKDIVNRDTKRIRNFVCDLRANHKKAFIFSPKGVKDVLEKEFEVYCREERPYFWNTQIMLPCKLNGKVPVRAFVDTGYSRTTISNDLACELSLENEIDKDEEGESNTIAHTEVTVGALRRAITLEIDVDTARGHKFVINAMVHGDTGVDMTIGIDFLVAQWVKIKFQYMPAMDLFIRRHEIQDDRRQSRVSDWIGDEGWQTLKAKVKAIVSSETNQGSSGSSNSDSDCLLWAEGIRPFNFMLRAIRKADEEGDQKARKKFHRYFAVYYKYFETKGAKSPQHFLDVLKQEYRKHLDGQFKPPLSNMEMQFKKRRDWDLTAKLHFGNTNVAANKDFWSTGKFAAQGKKPFISCRLNGQSLEIVGPVIDTGAECSYLLGKQWLNMIQNAVIDPSLSQELFKGEIKTEGTIREIEIELGDETESEKIVLKTTITVQVIDRDNDHMFLIGRDFLAKWGAVIDCHLREVHFEVLPSRKKDPAICRFREEPEEFPEPIPLVQDLGHEELPFGWDLEDSEYEEYEEDSG